VHGLEKMYVQNMVHNLLGYMLLDTLISSPKSSHEANLNWKV